MHIEVRFILLLLSFGYTLYLMVIIIYTLKTGVYCDLLHTHRVEPKNLLETISKNYSHYQSLGGWVGGEKKVLP